MGDLDPIRVPERNRFFRRLTVGVALALGLIASLQWWLASPWPRVVIVVAICVVIGWVAGRLMFRRKS